MSLDRRRAEMLRLSVLTQYKALRRRYTRAPTACQGCPLKCVCLPEKTPRRQLYSAQHAAVIEVHRQRMTVEGPQRMRQRASLLEHSFGTLKRLLGWDHFLVRGFAKVRGEMALMVLGCDLTRVLNILGWQAFRDYCAQRLSGHRAPAPAAVGA